MQHLSARIKNLLLAFCITATAFSAQAQWVSIPDSNFGKWLNTNGYNMCLQGNSTVGWQMDTTCNAVVSAKDIFCNNVNLKSIEGIQYFDNLEQLHCNENALTVLPALPNSLLELQCHYNAITSLPTLPNYLKKMWCYVNQLTSLPALPDSLKYLNCNSNQLTSLPALPNSLTDLECGYNLLTSLPVLPNLLASLSCNSNQITSLPALPNSLTYLSFWRNQLTYLSALPNSLIYLDCGRNQLTSLPPLPNSLTELWCYDNQLTSLPTLPNTLLKFLCHYNQLTSLPTLPNLLTSLNCEYNQLTSLPNLPNSLIELVCFNNQLTSLPQLPNNLTILRLSRNQLTSLPSLPSSLTVLDCSINQLTSLPSLPDSLYYLDCNDNSLLSCFPKLNIVKNLHFERTSIACLPNVPLKNTESHPLLNSVPLCDVFNTNGCDVFYNISGTVYADTTENCTRDVNESNIGGVKILLSRNGIVEQQSFLNNYGTYSFNTNPSTFDISIDTVGLPYTVACPSALFHTSIITAQDSIDIDKDFGLRCKPGFDLAVHSAVRDSGVLFPAQKAGVRIKAGDISQLFGLNCVSGVSGKVVVVFSGPVTYSGIRPGTLTPIVTGKTLTYTIADFGAIDINTAFGLIFLTDTFAQIGQQLCLSITVIPDVAGDIDNTNNNLRICLPIVNSYDPNMKEVSPVNSILPTEEWLTYTIHFQNMGNAPAFHIYVMDTLDNNLDESSIQILGSSHRMLTEIKGNIARFNFPNINLVDSATNEPESKGWLQYKIKKNTNLALGTQIKNTASIYFDFNAPVVTNTVINTVEQPNAVEESRNQLSEIRLFPNPTNDVVYISYTSNTSAEVTLFNINGAACLKQQLTASNQSISLSGLPSGVYFVSVEVEGNVVRKRVVKW